MAAPVYENPPVTASTDGTLPTGQKYGRWEACMKSDAGKGGINAVLLLWPVAGDWPVGGEVDWMEISSDKRSQLTVIRIPIANSSSRQSTRLQRNRTPSSRSTCAQI